MCDILRCLYHYLRIFSSALGFKDREIDCTFNYGGRNLKVSPLFQRIFSIIDMNGLLLGETIIKFPIHKDDADDLVLEKTFSHKFTSCSKQYALKNVWFCEYIQKRGIKLLKIDTVKKLGEMIANVMTKSYI